MAFFKRSEQRSGRRARLLFTTDLHGSDCTFRKLLKALEVWQPDALIVGGDVAGKAMLPVADLGGGNFRLRWMGKEHDVSSEGELRDFEDKVSQQGFYPYKASVDDITAARADEALAQGIFEQLIMERWSRWLELLEERCSILRLPAFVMGGNDDPWSLDPVTFADRKWVRGADRRVVPLLDDWKLLSCGLGNLTPWNCPRDTPEDQLEAVLRELADEAGDFGSVVANVHVPPINSTLDVAARLDTSVFPPRPIRGETAGVGSIAVRHFIEEFQPLAGLHGHIHESPGAINIGRTRCINPGSEYGEGVLRAVLLMIQPGRVAGEQFVTG